MVPNSAVMTVAAIFKCQLLKMAAERKKSYIFVTKWKLQVRFSMQSLHTYTSNDIKISTFLKKRGDEAEVVQCPFNVDAHLTYSMNIASTYAENRKILVSTILSCQ